MFQETSWIRIVPGDLQEMGNPKMQIANIRTFQETSWIGNVPGDLQEVSWRPPGGLLEVSWRNDMQIRYPGDLPEIVPESIQ